MADYTWLERRNHLSIDRLRLWAENPRLDPDEAHRTDADYVEDLIADKAEKAAFYELLQSIAHRGYIPADPIVVWKNPDNDRHYVAEGNRRVLALKLLREPAKAPKQIRSHVRSLAREASASKLKKIGVNIAPSFEDAEYYINQRHGLASLLRPWSRLQRLRWIANLYEKYDHDFEKVAEKTGYSKGELDNALRILRLRDYSLEHGVLKHLSTDEKQLVKSHRLPVTILERWFGNAVVRERWGIQFNGADFSLISTKKSFNAAYAKWISLVLCRDEPNVSPRINTRTITVDLEKILEALPEVVLEDGHDLPEEEVDDESSPDGDAPATPSKDDGEDQEDEKPKSFVNNPNRPKLVPGECSIKTGNHKIEALLGELKKIPPDRYPHCLAASIRVFVDLCVHDFIVDEDHVAALKKMYKSDFRDISLKKRLEFIKKNHKPINSKQSGVIQKLLNSENEFSLDTLNSYIHGSDTHHTGKVFLNNFWDFLFPLLQLTISMEYKH